MNRTVHILDYEILSPLGLGQQNLYKSIMGNVCAEDYLKQWPEESIPFCKAAQITEDLSVYYNDAPPTIQDICKFDRKFELLVSCTALAKSRMSGLIEKLQPGRTGTIVGVGVNVIPFEQFSNELFGYLERGQNPVLELINSARRGQQAINPLNTHYDIHAIHLAEAFRAGAFQRSIVTACVSSTQAIALASDSIKSGEADVVIVGGTDSILNALGMISFGKLGVISESSDEPSCKPFDLNRNGTLAGEAAGIAVLASGDFIQNNGLHPKAEILGYGNTLDGYNITAPDPGGTSMTKAIKDSVERAGITVSELDYINAHGTGTSHNDQLELECYLNALGEEVFNIPISSTKSRHGHAIAAAGVQELCIMLHCMKENIIPANLNLNKACDERFNLPKENIESTIKYGMTSNFAFGGVNTVLTLKNEMI